MDLNNTRYDTGAYRSYAQYREPRFLPFKKYLVTILFFSTSFNLPSYPAPISAVFSAKNTLHRLILSLSCIMTGASHSSSERWKILSEIREKRYRLHNKEMIS